MENKYTPIDYAIGHRTRFYLKFPPYLQTENIGVNVGRIDNLCRLGGINHLRIINNNDGETSSSNISIVGYGNNGEALAGRTGVKTIVPEYDTTSRKYDHDTIPHCCTWINTTLRINNNEIVQRINNEPMWASGTRSIQAWSEHLDKAIKEGIIKTGIKFLTLGLSSHNWTIVGLQYGILAMAEAIKGPTILSGITRVLMLSAFLNTFDYVKNLLLFEKEYRFSAFYGPQIDRALLLLLLTNKDKLIKPLTTTK